MSDGRVHHSLYARQRVKNEDRGSFCQTQDRIFQRSLLGIFPSASLRPYPWWVMNFSTQCPRDEQTAQLRLYLDDTSATAHLSTYLYPYFPEYVFPFPRHILFMIFPLPFFNNSESLNGLFFSCLFHLTSLEVLIRIFSRRTA